MICSALANMSFSDCLDAVKILDFAEIRFDLLDLSKEEITALFSANNNLIATCRLGKYDNSERKTLLLHAIDSGAAYVDIEVETGEAFKHDVVTAAREQHCQIIMSYHDFDRTPTQAELEHIVKWCSECKPDIIKIACMVRSARDNARLLGLLDTNRQMLVLGMGQQGKITRVVSPLLGSMWTFASYATGSETAPGQLFKDDLAQRIKEIQQL